MLRLTPIRTTRRAVTHRSNSRSNIATGCQWRGHMRSIRLAVLVPLTLLVALLMAPLARAAASVSFAGPQYSTAGTFPGSVAGAIFNGDGNADLAVANEFSDDVSVLLAGS